MTHLKQGDKPIEEGKIYCAFCGGEFSTKMKAEYDYCQGSEWTGRYAEEVKIEIYCDNCNRMIYTKKESL